MIEIKGLNFDSNARDDGDLEFEAVKVEWGDNFVVIFDVFQ
jgi:hypothetical protein